MKSIEITVNLPDGRSFTQPLPIGERPVGEAIKIAVDEIMKQYLQWTSMVVVFSNPEA